MRYSLRIAASVSIVFLLGSCFPEERFWWSPQGDRALVILEDGVHLVGTDGKLGKPLDGLATTDVGTLGLSWLPDGQGFIWEREREVKFWDEVAKAAPANEVKEVDALMPAVMPLIESAVKLAAPAEKLDQIASALPQELRTSLTPAFMRAYAADPAPIEKMLSVLPKGEDIIKSLRKEGSTFHLGKLCEVRLKDGQIDSTRVITTSLLSRHLFPKTSPKHAAVACLSAREGAEYASLEVWPHDGGAPLIITQRASVAYAWTPDGRSIVFASPIEGKDSKLMSIQCLTVLQEPGALMKEPYDKQADGSNLSVTGPDRLASPQLLATAVIPSLPRVQVLPDGRVLFASHPATLPSAGTELQREPQLYLIAADGSEVQRVPTAPGELPSDLSVFVASPDGQRVAVVESETDAVAVVELSTGKTQIVSPAHEQWKCETVPAWRTSNDLTFAALHGTSPTPQWMQWTVGQGTRCLSESWPAGTIAKWLEHPKPTQPSTP